MRVLWVGTAAAATVGFCHICAYVAKDEKKSFTWALVKGFYTKAVWWNAAMVHTSFWALFQFGGEMLFFRMAIIE